MYSYLRSGSVRASSRGVYLMEPPSGPYGRRCGARGRGRTHPPAPRAAPGLRPGALRPPARSSLTAALQAKPGGPARGLTEKAPRASSQRQGETDVRKRGPAPNDRRMARREAPAFLARGTRQDGRRCAARRVIPSCLAGQARQAGVPAPLKNRGDFARPHVAAGKCGRQPRRPPG